MSSMEIDFSAKLNGIERTASLNVSGQRVEVMDQAGTWWIVAVVDRR